MIIGKETLNETLTAGQLSYQALKDHSSYDARDLALQAADEITDQLREAINNYRDRIDENEFCVVYVIATDPLLINLKRRKFYCWPWLPSPRPNQSVFLYNKGLDRITKRLWVLPDAITMSELASPGLIVHKRYQTMQNWSKSFYKGSFWKDIRDEHKISMLSQEEWFDSNRGELAKSGLDLKSPSIADSFDFSKIAAGQFKNTKDVLSV